MSVLKRVALFVWLVGIAMLVISVGSWLSPAIAEAATGILSPATQRDSLSDAFQCLTIANESCVVLSIGKAAAVSVATQSTLLLVGLVALWLGAMLRIGVELQSGARRLAMVRRNTP